MNRQGSLEVNWPQAKRDRPGPFALDQTTFQNEFILKSGLIQRERPRPVSLGLRPIHLQGTLTVHLRAKRRRRAAVALRIALRGSLSHYPSLRNLW